MKKNKETKLRSSALKSKVFNFDNLSAIMGQGIQVIERELTLLAKKSETQGLTDIESKILISYIGALREVKKDYQAEVALVQKELKSLSTEELQAMLVNK